LIDIERVIIGWSPAPANLNITDVQAAASYALNLFSGTVPVPPEVPHPLPVTKHEPNPHPSAVPIHDVSSDPPSNTAEPTPLPQPAKTVPPAKDLTAAAEPAAPSEKATPQATTDPNADVAVRIAADAEASRGTVVNPQAPTGEDAAKLRAPSGSVQDAGASFLIANSIGQAILFKPDNFYTPDATPPEFITVSSPLDSSGAVVEEKLIDADSVTYNVPDTPAPIEADLLLDFVPFDMADIHVAVGSFLTELEQLCFGNGGRCWVGMGLLLASVVATGLTGQTAWERMRRRGRSGASDEAADGRALWFLPLLGMPEPEVP
jgi:hypothetical protein